MHALNLAAFKAAALQREPFDYVIVPGFVKREALDAVNGDYPRIPCAGSFPVGQLTYGPAFCALVEALAGQEMRTAFAGKFGIDLTGRPTMITVRGQSSTKDGHIHTDAATKLITVLIYLNPHWEDAGGRLRLLRSPDNINDTVVEVPPVAGTLLAFRRSHNSFHGHKPFIGPRRVIQLNWLTDHLTARREIMRHRFSAWVKRVLVRVRPPVRQGTARRRAGTRRAELQT